MTISTSSAKSGEEKSERNDSDRNSSSSAEDTADDVVQTVEQSTDDVADRVHAEIDEHPWFRRVTQVGWLAKGVVYGSLGWAAVEIAMGSTAPDDAEYTGIVTSLASGGYTRVLLALIGVGLVFYILFRLASVALIDDNDLDAWAHRVGYLASAGTYAAVSWAAAGAAIRGPQPKGEGTVERLSRSLLESTPGRVALVVGGCIALGVSVYFLFKGATRRFMDQIDQRDLGPRERRLIEYTGAVGWVGRGFTVLVVALFVTWSAIDADPRDARGLDSSMNRIANEERLGQPLVLVIGIALLIYAAYCIISSRRRRLAWENNPEPAGSDSPKKDTR